jgi:hypothetical protein
MYGFINGQFRMIDAEQYEHYHGQGFAPFGSLTIVRSAFDGTIFD